MKTKLFCLVLSCFCVIGLQAQRQAHVVELEAKEALKDFIGFYCAEVIDNRIIKGNMGYAQIGMNNRVVPALMNGQFVSGIQDYLNIILPPSSEREPLVFIVHELNVSEVTSGMSEVGYCFMEIELARRIDDQLYSLGNFITEVKGKKADVTKGHHVRIEYGLKKAIYEFNSMDWQSEGKPIQLEEPLANFIFEQIPPRGLYKTFNQLARQKPIPDQDFNLRQVSGKKYPWYSIRNRENKNLSRQIFAISDGSNIYLNANRYSYNFHFVKAKHIGRFIYFEDKFSNPTMGVIFGLTGTLLSNAVHGIILDTKNGVVSMLTDINMDVLVSQHPLLKVYWENSNKKIDAREQVIFELNKKY